MRHLVRVALVLVALVAGCSQFDVHVHSDPSVDLGQLRSWAWLPPELLEPADQRLLDRYLDRKLRAAVDRVLREKGYVPAGPGDTPDLFVNYRLTTSDRSSTQPPYGYDLGTWWGHADIRSRDSYPTGTLLLDFVRPESRALVWRGTAAGRLVPHASLEKSARRTELVVEHILAEFPARR